MAYPQEQGEAMRFWKLSRPNGPINMQTAGINWRIFWACFEIGYGRYMLSVRTPWFQVLLSSGGREWVRFARWYGLRAHWGHVKNWNVGDGCILFAKGDHLLSFIEPQLMREY